MAALFLVQPVEQTRERSIIEVTPNGGNNEVFHVNFPDDRILIGAANQASPVPRGLDWPDVAVLADVRTELFKIRNSNDIVIGVASRISTSGKGSGNGAGITEWAIHMPARGSSYVLMRPSLEDKPYLVGDLRAGTREFSGMTGQVTERWVANSTESDMAPVGRLELSTRFVATLKAETSEDES